jgi:Flp pilus assembly protein TadB
MTQTGVDVLLALFQHVVSMQYAVMLLCALPVAAAVHVVLTGSTVLCLLLLPAAAVRYCLLQVEAAAKEMAKEVAVSLEESAQLVARAERGLEVGAHGGNGQGLWLLG